MRREVRGREVRGREGSRGGERSGKNKEIGDKEREGRWE